MKNSFNFNAAEVACNGVGGYGYQAVLKYQSQVQAIVDEVTNEISREQLFELANSQTTETWPLYPGSRFNSNQDLMYRLCTGLGNYLYEAFESNELVEMYVGALLDRLTKEEKTQLVVDAARDCASADHWYTFEKEWE